MRPWTTNVALPNWPMLSVAVQSCCRCPSPIARLVSLPLDGAPSWLFYGFLGSEAAGIVAIAWYSRSTLERP